MALSVYVPVAQKATGARFTDSQFHRFEETPILEGFSNLSEGFTVAEPCIQ